MRWGQLGNPSSHWTTGLTSQWFFPLLLALTVFHWWLSAHLPPAEDELYYWAWSRQLQWSYYDHPPLVAYLIRISTGIFGQSLFGIRFFACLLSTLTLALMGVLTSEKQILGCLFFTPLFFIGSILMTPDIPLTFFWVCYALWMVNINHTLSQWHDDPITRVYRKMPVSLLRWGMGGVLLGLGCLGKYTMLIALPCSLMAFVSKYRGKAWVTGFVFHCLVGFAVCLPVLIFNIQHDFTPFRFQWAHAMGSFDFSLKRFFEFVGTQILLVGALPFLLLPSTLVKSRELCENPRLQICFFFFLVPLLFFLLQATKSHVEANWPIVCYLTFWPLAQRLNEQNSFHGIRRLVMIVSFLVPLATTGLIVLHCLSPLHLVAPGRDRLGKLRAQYTLSEQMARDLNALNLKLPVFAPSYQWTSYLRFQKIAAEQLHPESRESHFTLVPKNICDERQAIVLQDAANVPAVLRCLPHQQLIKQYDLVVRGEALGRYQIVKYYR